MDVNNATRVLRYRSNEMIYFSKADVKSYSQFNID